MARIILLFCLFVSGRGIQMNSLKLEQVIILSRHNLRTPLTTNSEVFARKIWPKFNDPVGHLTKKGILLESYMANYISEWLASENFINGCPKKDDVLIYSNTRARTRATADSFANTAFPSCNITNHHEKNIEVFDPVFHPIFHNNSKYFIKKMFKEMERKLTEINATNIYLELNRILDIQNSDICEQKSLCDLSVMKNEPILEDGDEPIVSGSLSIATNIVDLFLMSYYEGFPIAEVAWGQIRTEEQWKLLTKVLKDIQYVRFNFKPGAEDISGPLLNYIFGIFKSGKPKFAALFGHDSNYTPLLCALGFKEYELEGQYEPSPIGGKLIFQKWSDGVNNYLKVEYVYQSVLQIRNAVELSLERPPYKVLMEMDSCKIDANGFCPWEDFMKFDF